MVALVSLMIGEECDVKPGKVVAGLEPEKTNIFLQNLYQCAVAGVDTTPYVNQVLGIGGEEEEGDDGEAQRQAEAEAEAQR
jgi:TRAF3-interacting protein 1